MASTSLAVPLIPSTLSDTYSLPQLPCLLCLPTYLQIRKTSLFRLTLFLPSVILGPWQFNRQAFLFYLCDSCFWRGYREEAILQEFFFYLLPLELFLKTLGCQGGRRRREGATDRQICSNYSLPCKYPLPIPYLSLQLQRALHHV